MSAIQTAWFSRIAGAWVLLLALPVAAATNETAGGSVATWPELVVTVRKWWTEPLQDVPGAVSVRSADDISAAGSKDLRDAARDIPNLTLGEFSPRRLTFPYVRGIGSGQNAPAVTTCIDGVPQLSYVTANQELLDVERIEFLRGPQGALYGSDTLGGVINIVPRLPASEPAGALTLSAGDHSMVDGRFSAGGPLAPGGPLGSLSGGYATREGFTKNDVTGNDIDSREAWFGRGQIYFPRQDPWDFRLSLTAEQDRDGDYALYDLASLRANPHHAAHDYEGSNERDLAQPVFTARRHGDDADFISITAYQWWQTRDRTDLDYTSGDLMRKDLKEDEAAWIEELRLSSPAHAPVPLGDRVDMHWLAGVFAFDESYTQHANTDYRPDGVLHGLWPSPFQMENDAALDNSGASLFGQTIFTLDERWELGLGLREDYAERSANLRSGVPSGPTLSSSDPDRDFDQLSPRASLGYHFTPGILAYAEASKGYRAGGFNAVSPPGRDSYDEETCWNYETGLKTAWLENRLIVSAALFHADWEDLQVNSHVPGGNASDYYIENAGKATSEGAEFELTAKPLQGLELFGGVGFVDAEYGAGSRSADVDVGGNDLPFAPSFNWHAGSEYTAELAAHRSAFARIEVTGVSRYQYDPSNLESQGSYSLVNLRLGMATGAWRVEGWAKNLFDRDYVPLAIPYGQDALGNPLYVGESGDPRTIGLSLTRAF